MTKTKKIVDVRVWRKKFQQIMIQSKLNFVHIKRIITRVGIFHSNKILFYSEVLNRHRAEFVRNIQ